MAALALDKKKMQWKKDAVSLIPESAGDVLGEEFDYSASLYIQEYLLSYFKKWAQARDSAKIEAAIGFAVSLFESGDESLWNAASVSFFERFLNGLDEEISKFVFKKVPSRVVAKNWYLSAIQIEKSW